jgi:hypothetical protein
MRKKQKQGKYHYDIQDRYDAIAFDQRRFINSKLKEYLFKQQIYTDFSQAILEGAIISRNQYINLDEKDSYLKVARIVNKSIYNFLTSYGFKRGRNYKGYQQKIEPYIINLPDSIKFKYLMGNKTHEQKIIEIIKIITGDKYPEVLKHPEKYKKQIIKKINRYLQNNELMIQ